MFVIKYRKIFFAISGLLVLASVLLVVFQGLNFGIDFTGGSIMEVSFTNERPEAAEIRDRLNNLAIGDYKLQLSGDDSLVLRTRNLSESERVAILDLMSFGGEFQPNQEKFNTVGPVIGEELKEKAYIAIVVVVVAIIIFIAFSFRKVSYPVSSWKYGLVAILALIHDIVIPVGIFTILGQAVGAEIDILFVTALLAILGFSVNDTIVVFDRIRENLRLNQEKNKKEDFPETVGRSLNQTYARSINTSLTTLLVLLALLLLGGDSTKFFALTLVIGVIFGTYSSIFLASPLLVALNKGK